MPSSDLWTFATGVYRDEAVRHACLRVQDDYGVDVLFCLACSWWSLTSGRAPSRSEITALLAQRKRWRTWTEQLRRLRREVQPRSEGAGDADDEAWQQRFYERLKEVELLAEEAGAAELERMIVSAPSTEPGDSHADTASTAADGTAARAELVRRALQTYAAAEGRPDAEDSMSGLAMSIVTAVQLCPAQEEDPG